MSNKKKVMECFRLVHWSSFLSEKRQSFGIYRSMNNPDVLECCNKRQLNKRTSISYFKRCVNLCQVCIKPSILFEKCASEENNLDLIWIAKFILLRIYSCTKRQKKLVSNREHDSAHDSKFLCFDFSFLIWTQQQQKRIELQWNKRFKSVMKLTSNWYEECYSNEFVNSMSGQRNIEGVIRMLFP